MTGRETKFMWGSFTLLVEITSNWYRPANNFHTKQSTLVNMSPPTNLNALEDGSDTDLQ